MTATEMLNLWKVGFEVFASNSAPGFEDSDVFILLNRAQDLTIEELVLQKNWLRLQAILKEATLSPSTESITGFSYAAVPADYNYYADSYSVTTRSAITTTGFMGNKAHSSKPVKNQDISVEVLDKFYLNGFDSILIFKEPKACVKSGNIYVIPDSYTTISSIILRYVKKRREIGVGGSLGDCELDESLHRIIVEKAIDLAKKIIFIQEPQSSN